MIGSDSSIMPAAAGSAMRSASFIPRLTLRRTSFLYPAAQDAATTGTRLTDSACDMIVGMLTMLFTMPVCSP